MTEQVFSSHGSSKLSRRWVLIYVLASILLLMRLVKLGSGTNFFFDEWQFVVERSVFDSASFLQPHNGHLVAFPVAIYMLLVRIVGLDQHWVFGVFAVLAHLCVANLVATLVRRRRGEFAGLCSMIVVAFMGAGWQNIFWSFQIGFVASIAFFLGSLLVLDVDKDELSRARRIVASCLMMCSLLSSGVGVAALVATSFVCVVRPERARVWWVPIAPVLMYGVWYLSYGESSVSLGAYTTLPEFGGEATSAAVGGVFGVGENIGQILLGMLLVVLLGRFRQFRSSRVSVATVVFYGTFVVLVALSRSSNGEPTASRYLYVGIIAIVVALGASPTTLAWPSKALPGILAVLAIWGSNSMLESGARTQRMEGELISANLAVVESYGSFLDPALPVDPVHAPQLSVGGYLLAVARFDSSPAARLSDVSDLGFEARLSADLIIDRAIVPIELSVAGEDCTVGTAGVTNVSASPGASVLISGFEPTNYTIRRFNLDASRAAGRSVDFAIVKFEFPRDQLDLPFHLVFDKPVDVVTCPH